MSLPLPEPSARRGRRPQVHPEAILDAALDVFGEKGFAAARLDDIARRAGVSKGTLYLYFASKEEIFKAMVRQAVVPNVGQFEAWATVHPGPASAMIADLYPRLAQLFGASRIARVPKIVLTEAQNFPDIARFWAAEVVEHGLGVIRLILARGVAAGEFSPVRVETAFVMIAPLLFLALWNTGMGPALGRPLDPQAIAAEATRLLIGGLKSHPEEP